MQKGLGIWVFDAIVQSFYSFLSCHRSPPNSISNENNWFHVFQEVSEPAAVALVNLSQRSAVAAKMVDMGMINLAMDLLFKSEPNISRLLVMLLVNLTQLESGTASLLQVCFFSSVHIMIDPLEIRINEDDNINPSFIFLRRNCNLLYAFIVLLFGFKNKAFS